MAIALMKPLASNDFEVNFSPESFAFYADAYRELAEEIGIEARALQSITWEAARAIFPAKKKSSPGYKDKISSIWDKFNNGESTINEVHSEIFNQAEDPNLTEWSEYIKILKDESKRKDVSGRIIRKKRIESADKLGDISRAYSGVSRTEGKPSTGDGGSKVEPSRKKQISGRRS